MSSKGDRGKAVNKAPAISRGLCGPDQLHVATEGMMVILNAKGVKMEMPWDVAMNLAQLIGQRAVIARQSDPRFTNLARDFAHG